MGRREVCVSAECRVCTHWSLLTNLCSVLGCKCTLDTGHLSNEGSTYFSRYAEMCTILPLT